jgi:hypothetical protein
MNHMVEFYEIWYGGDAVKRDPNAIIFNPMSSIILQLLRFTFVGLALVNCGFGFFTFYCNHSYQVVYCTKSG